MSAPIAALFGRGIGGLPPAAPVDFARLRLPASPNTCLAAPAGAHPEAHIAVPPLPVDAATAWPALRALGDGMPRVFRYGEWPERRQAQWVARSALMNYPDIIAAELVPGPAGAGLFLYSRSLFGWSDLGVNRKRVEAWLAALDAALRRR
ncbi:DUF1499 domain-containing protein [Roseicella sp. DB1501]|uniref:DUF1499 domain-containing protein n=1 Tax=Roseicella sp. DB1501 TaxID=2730925 RepID=UPI0014914BB8|nr:DUF1499 domain-containing protein [Roseicella sp. DB1501]NOG69691.1 DUF1499 domain-containing protein [Roseicella sp. DB1501]